MVALLASTNLVGRRLDAAERIDFHIEGMTIPIHIDELEFWNKTFNKNTLDTLKEFKGYSELYFWLNMLGFESRAALSDFLETPLVKNKGFTRQLLRSWVGQRLLDEVSDLVVVDEDKTGSKIFSTLENLLEVQDEVSLLDLLRALPGEVIYFDAEGWLRIFTNWRDELERQQRLLRDLNQLSNKSNLSDTQNDRFNTLKSYREQKKIKLSHRNEGLNVEIWRPIVDNSLRKNWIVFMPGLGGDPYHFRWLAETLSQKGWEVVVIDHPGSNNKAMQSLVEGRNLFPEANELFKFRLDELHAVLNAKKQGYLKVKANKVVLVGHSLGSLTAFLASGAIPQKGLEERCNRVSNNLSITNLSRILQCQIKDINLQERRKVSNISAIIGINSFGKLLWPDSLNEEINIPFFLTGGTFDLVTPALTEQLSLLLSTNPNKYSRALIIEGASHFSPIRVSDQYEEVDLYKISDYYIGIDPLTVQNLLSIEITRFLENLENRKTVPVFISQMKDNMKFHILDRSIITKITRN